MRVTKAILEERNESLKATVTSLTKDKILLEDKVKLLQGVIDTYSRMSSLIIATEKISDALAHTVAEVSRNGRR